MGSSVYTHIGPYLRISLQPLQYTENVNCCDHYQCESYHVETDDTFCRRCGSKVGFINVQRQGQRTWADFNQHNNYEYEGDFQSPEYIGGDNEEVILCYDEALELDDDVGYLSLATVDTKSDLQAFEFKYKKALDEIRAFFSDTHVTVEYGVCSYWS